MVQTVSLGGVGELGVMAVLTAYYLPLLRDKRVMVAKIALVRLTC